MGGFSGRPEFSKGRLYRRKQMTEETKKTEPIDEESGLQDKELEQVSSGVDIASPFSIGSKFPGNADKGF
jgi:hypothetical protein